MQDEALHKREVLILIFLTLALLVPFVGKPFHIDDPLFLAMARQIRVRPLDPYGFEINWADRSAPAWLMIENPPLASYLIAGASYIVGWGEVGLHSFFLIPAIMTVVGVYILAKRFCANAFVAGLTFLVTPVFLLSSTLVMCDTLMTCLWIWALICWFKGKETGRLRFFLGSALLVSLAGMTKYFGLALLPLLLLLALTYRRSIRWRALVIIIPIVVAMGWELWTKSAYGRGLLSDAAEYSRYFRNLIGADSGLKVLIALSFAGGCIAAALCCAPILLSRRGIAAFAVLGGTIILLISRMQSVGLFPLRTADGIGWLAVVQLGVMVLGGMWILLLGFWDLVRSRNSESLFLFTWMLGTFLFAALFNWSVNGRSILPMAPAISFLLVRLAEKHHAGRVEHVLRRFAAPLAVTCLLSVAVGYADYTFAQCAKNGALAAAKFGRDAGTFWFEGHWGFHHYMESEGARPIDIFKSVLRPHDIVVYPENACDLIPLPDDAVVSVEVIKCKPFGWLATMHRESGAGFFADVWGPMPFVFGRVPVEQFHVLEVRRLCEPPLSAQARITLGIEALRERKADEAIRHLAEAIRYNPESAYAHEMLGLALLLGNEVDQAIKAFKRSLAIRPNVGGVHSNLAVAYMVKREYEKAWQEVHLARNCGYEPPRELVEALSLFMSDPLKRGSD